MADILVRRVLVLIALASVAGCGGGSNAALPNAPLRTASIVTKTIQIQVPGPQKSGSRIPDYVSRNTQGIGVSFGASPFTFPVNTAPTAAFDVSNTSPLCTVTNTTTGSRTCTLTVAAPVGSDDFQVTAWGAVPVSNSFTGDTALSTVTMLSQTIASGTNTPLNLTLNGIVNSVNTTVSPSSLPAQPTGTPATATLSVNALDAYGNIILGSGSYVGANGAPLTITVTQAATSNGGALVTTMAATTVTPVASTIAITYPGGNSWGTVFTPTVSGGTIAGSATAGMLNITPTILFYNPLTANSMPNGIASDGTNIWFTEATGNNIGKIALATGVVSEFPVLSAGAFPAGITHGPDGNMWFAECGVARVTAMTTSGSTIGEYTSGISAGSQPNKITTGPDGNLWFTEISGPSTAGGIGKITTAGAVTEYSVPGSGNQPYGITTGSDGNLWFAMNCANSLQNITTGGVFSAAFPVTASTNPKGITSASDGNIWFAEFNGSAIGKMAPPGGAPTIYPVPGSLGQIGEIIQGGDGAMWFTGRNISGTGGIGRSTLGGVITSFFTGFSASDHPEFITNGPDGSIWFAEGSGNKIGRLIY